MADKDVWALTAISSPAATDRMPFATGAGGGGYSERGDFVWKNASGVWQFAGQISGNIGLNVTPSVRFHVKDASAEIIRLETTTARGGGNIYQTMYDPSGRKCYYGYGAASDNFTFMNEMNSDFRLGTNNAFRWQIVSVGHLAPYVDNAYDLGGGALRLRTVYATTGSINTSDAREKTAIRSFTASEIAAARRIASEIGIFQFLDGTREHVGVIAQAVWAIMADEGLVDPIVEGELPSSRYAFLCYDEWEADVERDIEAGNRFGIRPDQLALFLIAAQEARISALEA